MKNITILGATGSIGTSTLEVIDIHPDKFQVFALSANTSWQKILQLCTKYQPKYAVMADEKSALKLQKHTKTKVLFGHKSLEYITTDNEVDMVMCAIVGASGMQSTMAAAKAGKKILLANKESMVLAGEILIKTAKDNNAKIIPVDSEHSAVFQVLTNNKQGFDKIELTASGGPFLHTPLNELKNITPAQACNHPNWSMGRKISVDSATMMNKGLEVIEAFYLFNVPYNKIDVIIHPQSIIHSSVYFSGGSVISQLGNPDMKTAISYAMSYPQRMESGASELDLTKHKLEFFSVDKQKFKNLDLAYQALKAGAGSIGVLNAANEVAVDSFLDKKIDFLQIPQIVEKTLDKIENKKITNLEQVIENDKYARRVARGFV